jgi:hypothetical protein
MGRPAPELAADGQPTESALPPLAASILRWAVWSSSAVVLACFAILTVAHIGDRYESGWVQGTRMALAQYANEGIVFPPLYDGTTYGGTRFMPLPVLLHAGTARLTGEYLMSGKLLSLVTTLAMLGLVFLLLRRMGCPTEIGVGLTAAVAGTMTGFHAMLSIQGDSLPVALQLGAVGLVAHRTERRSVTWAAALSVLALLAKLSAVWAPPAIAVWLLLRRRRDLGWFVAWFAAFLVLGFAILELVSGGRALTNIYELSFAGVSGLDSLLRSPLRAIGMASEAGAAFLVLVPFAFLAMLLPAGRAWRIYSIALALAVVSLLVILVDEGTGVNHLIDVAVLSAMGVGVLASTAGRSDIGKSVIAAAVAVALVWGMLVFAVLNLRPQVLGALTTLRSGPSARYTPTTLADRIGQGDLLLAEDPYLPVSLDRFPPVILDAWALLRLEHRHPEWIADLAARIQREEFDWIVLSYGFDFEGWYSEVHLGDKVATAIRDHYRPLEEAGTDGYFVYVPAERPVR